MEKEAEYQISSSKKDGILEIILTGKLIEGAFEGLQLQIDYIIQAEGEKNLLVDARNLKGRTRIIEAYMRSKRPLPNIPKMNVAIVDLPENAYLKTFFEGAAKKDGHSLTFFADMDTARNWLKDNLRNEGRKAERLEEKNEVAISVISGDKNLPKEKITDNYCLDISVTGTRIHTNILLPVNTLLMVEFSLDDFHEKINALGKVKWNKVIIKDESYEAGVEFSSPSKKLAEYIGLKQKSKNLNPV